MRCMLFARVGATITHVGTGMTDQLGGWREPAHPSNGLGAKISAIMAQSNANLLELFVLVALHSDHIVGATLA